MSDIVQTDYTYDDSNLKKTISEGNRDHELEYDAKGQVTKKTLDNGFKEEYTYDNSGRLAMQVARDSNGSQMGSAAFGYDNADNAISEASTGYYGGYSKTFTYDNRGLLTGETRTNWNPTVNTYSYDGMGCRTQKVIGGQTTNYTYNGLGRITSDGQIQYTYDNNGNLLSRGTESFQFDWKNNLVRYQDSGAGKDIYLGYDIGNTLVAKGWNTEEEMSALSTAAKKPRKGVKGVIDTSKSVFTTTTTRSIDCFADLNCDEEIFYIKSYNTSVMYNMMYEMSGAGMLDMLRHWTPEIAEYNYDQNDPTGLALGLHQTLTHLFGNFPASINTAEQLTTRSHQDVPGVFTAINPQELELKGWDDHRPVGGEFAIGVIVSMVLSTNDRLYLGYPRPIVTPVRKKLDIAGSITATLSLRLTPFVFPLGIFTLPIPIVFPFEWSITLKMLLTWVFTEVYQFALPSTKPVSSLFDSLTDMLTPGKLLKQLRADPLDASKKQTTNRGHCIANSFVFALNCIKHAAREEAVAKEAKKAKQENRAVKKVNLEPYITYEEKLTYHMNTLELGWYSYPEDMVGDIVDKSGVSQANIGVLAGYEGYSSHEDSQEKTNVFRANGNSYDFWRLAKRGIPYVLYMWSPDYSTFWWDGGHAVTVSGTTVTYSREDELTITISDKGVSTSYVKGSINFVSVIVHYVDTSTPRTFHASMALEIYRNDELTSRLRRYKAIGIRRKK